MTITIIEERLASVTHLDDGAHSGPGDGICLLEAVAYITGEPWSDRPACACPVIARYAMNLNDRMPEDQRQRLLPYIVRIAGSRATPEIEQQRAYKAATWACKVFAPLALDARGLGEYAATLRALPDITDGETALGAKAASAASAAAYAAYASAYAVDAADAAVDADAYAREKARDKQAEIIRMILEV